MVSLANFNLTVGTLMHYMGVVSEGFSCKLCIQISKDKLILRGSSDSSSPPSINLCSICQQTAGQNIWAN